MNTPPKRVLVTHSRTVATRRSRQCGVADLRDHTAVGAVMLRSLMHAQLRLALRVFAVFVLLLGGLPLAFAVVPGLGDVRVGDIPLMWLILVVLVFPVLVVLGAVYIRQADRIERDFAELVDTVQ